MANRLSEIEGWKVLLLEAGIEEPQVADVPAFAPSLRRSLIDWEFQTQPQRTNCRARRNQRCIWPRGRVMGGTSTINYMIYLRGAPEDYNDWAAMGNPGWSYDEVLPYFLKSEDNRNIYNVDKEYQGTVSQQYHASNGEWTVEYYPYQDSNTLLSLEAWKEMGLDIFDQNEPRQLGAMLLQHSSRDGVRLSTNMAFVEPVRYQRKNLRVISQAYVTRILINPVTKEAYGVEYVHNNRLVQAMAVREVILSAGVINSPKILMLSGIGPKQDLEDLNITVVQHLPGVGRNLHDHTTIDGLMIALSNLTATTVQTEQQNRDIFNYVDTHRGPMSSTGPLQINSFVKTSLETNPNRADIQYSLDSSDVGNFYSDPILTDEANVLPLAYYNGLTIRPVLLAPKSRGWITLNTTHPVFGPPLIYPNTFVEQEDVLRMLEGIRIGLRFGNTKVFQNVGAQIVANELPACSQFTFGTDEYFVCIMEQYTTTLYHPVGTCKMGPGKDHLAVVDPELRVYGIKNLRVIDSSIMPVTPRANTNTATIMIAEKGSDFIKIKWNNEGVHNKHGDQGQSIDESLNYVASTKHNHFTTKYSLKSIFGRFFKSII
ncbi:unnamed protein product [Brassicogethes aeneus]|uniref:Glucose dehydrogenase n=1 Tax=Brassicogethes aeneus TaxID=1431903 RepID=A0A9P0AVS1_BRAAE|nr:unnamed protein product [Brassicogethes aeneus]